MNTYAKPEPDKQREQRREAQHALRGTPERQAQLAQIEAERVIVAAAAAAKRAPKPKVWVPLSYESFERRVTRLTKAFEKMITAACKDLGIEEHEADIFAYDFWPPCEAMDKRPDVKAEARRRVGL